MRFISIKITNTVYVNNKIHVYKNKKKFVSIYLKQISLNLKQKN